MPMTFINLSQENGFRLTDTIKAKITVRVIVLLFLSETSLLIKSDNFPFTCFSLRAPE